MDTVLAAPWVLREQSPSWLLRRGRRVAVVLHQLPGHLGQHTLGQCRGGRLGVGRRCLQPVPQPPFSTYSHPAPFPRAPSSRDHNQEFTKWAGR